MVSTIVLPQARQRTNSSLIIIGLIVSLIIWCSNLYVKTKRKSKQKRKNYCRVGGLHADNHNLISWLTFWIYFCFLFPLPPFHSFNRIKWDSLRTSPAALLATPLPEMRPIIPDKVLQMCIHCDLPTARSAISYNFLLCKCIHKIQPAIDHFTLKNSE